MAATTVTMPQLGESVVEGTIVKWLAQPGQRIEGDQPLVQIATPKANTEGPSPRPGPRGSSWRSSQRKERPSGWAVHWRAGTTPPQARPRERRRSQRPGRR